MDGAEHPSHPAAESSTPTPGASDDPPQAKTTGLAVMPQKALAIRTPSCTIHRFDTSRLTCQVCGLRIYVEVRIS